MIALIWLLWWGRGKGAPSIKVGRRLRMVPQQQASYTDVCLTQTIAL